MMPESISGKLGLEQLRLLHFSTLSHEQQAQAIRRQAASGLTYDLIARATGLHAEQIRRILSEPTL